MPARIALWGNLEPPFSTENEYVDAWRRAGHEVLTFQEGDADATRWLLNALGRGDVELLHWSRTPGLAERLGTSAQWEVLRTAGRKGVPVLGIHLDIWHDLERETQLRTDPYFRGVDLMLTANGDPEANWEQYGIDHQWLPPGVSERWTHEGNPRQEWQHDVVFTGSWQGGYHPESKHRHALVDWLRRNYAGRVAFYPEPGMHAVRGDDLTDLYWSAKTVVGDSLAVKGDPDKPGPVPYYCSDRYVEAPGRGAIFVCPEIEGINRQGDDLWFPNNVRWQMWDWGDLRQMLDAAIEMDDDERLAARKSGLARVVDHTYTHRCGEIIDIATKRGLL